MIKKLKTVFIVAWLCGWCNIPAMALTDGPTQPEVQQFTPVTASDMVNLFTGDFLYNIFLFELPGPNGGYPFNLAYRSGITMDQEATWVGLGWNLSVGSINRQMRCLPDEFNGLDSIIKTSDLLDNKTFSMGLNASVEGIGMDPDEVVKLSPSYGITMYYNNYKGFGFTPELGVGVSFGGKSPMTAGIGLTVKSDNQEGAIFSPNISLGFKSDEGKASINGGLNLGLNYSSRMGLTNVTLGASFSASDRHESMSKRGPYSDGQSASISGSATMSFNNAFITSPSINNPTRTSAFEGMFKMGGYISGVQFAGAIHGSFSKETLIDKMRDKKLPAFGYMYLQDGRDKTNAAMDFIREKDGQIHKDIRNLAAPVLTHDIYTVNGQGFTGMFRPYRTDVGAVNDRTERSSSDGTNVSFDLSGGWGLHVGSSISLPSTFTKSEKWKTGDNDIHGIYKFHPFKANDKFEPYYFQFYGESKMLDINSTEQLIGGFKPSYIDIAQTGKLDFTTKQHYGNSTDGIQTITSNTPDDRIQRGVSIQEIRNEYLYDTLLLPECKAYYVNRVSGSSNTVLTLNRALDSALYKRHHVGAFIVTTTDGKRYIYALPVYNFKQVEASFSTDNEEISFASSPQKYAYNQVPDAGFTASGKYVNHNCEGCGTQSLDRTEIPAYTFTHMLTAVLGADYVDVTGDGVTEDDLGYWVKFTYTRADNRANPYKWRAPFTSANYVEGMYSTDADNMGSYMYGERENYYLYRAETKTHQADFYTSARYDAKGATTEFQVSSSPLGRSSYKLDSIFLLSKFETDKPVKRFYFQYSRYSYTNPKINSFNANYMSGAFELCSNVPNSGASTTAGADYGKLTLRALYVVNGQNDRGFNNPYQFNYFQNLEAHNPDYNAYAYDRWGNFQEYDNEGDFLEIKYNPYSKQKIDGMSNYVSKLDQWASAWHMKEMVLPSGAKMKIDYEAKRYSYVQNKPAMQMYTMKGINATSHSGDFSYYAGKNGGSLNYVYVEFDRPVKDTNDLLDNRQLYYKIYVDLYNDGSGRYNDFVTGYADVHHFELDEDSLAVKIYLDKIDLKKGKDPVRDEHPFALAAWNFIQTSRPELMGRNPNGPLEPGKRSGKEVMNILRTVLSALVPTLEDFRNFYSLAYNKKLGLKLDYEKSFVRLNTMANKQTGIFEKFGGGSRVKSVLVYAADTTEVVTGQFFDYTTVENGKKISSGVAANEPSIGGDECALKSGKKGYFEPKFKTAYVQFQEMPINESYMPGPDIGYSKVTVASYTTKKILDTVLSAKIPSTGLTVNEFYTAKDFPTIFMETELTSKPLVNTMRTKNFPVRFRPLVGTITESYLAATQGYYTEVNNMHGKEKKVSYYGMNTAGQVLPDPTSYVEYLYKSDRKLDEKGREYFVLNNEVNAMYGNLNGLHTKLMGTDYEYFLDTRKSQSRTENIGGRVNLELIPIPAPLPPFFWILPIPTLFPEIGYDDRRSFTCVTNKIVNKFGILEKTKVFKEGALTETTNNVFDGYTGQPVLTTVNNDFKDPVYNYTIPGHWIYEGLGANYSTDNYYFTGNVTAVNEVAKELCVTIDAFTDLGDIQVGDELLVNSRHIINVSNGQGPQTQFSTTNVYPNIRCIINKIDGEKLWLQQPDGQIPNLLGNCYLKVYRAVRHNVLNTTVGNVVSQQNPIWDWGPNVMLDQKQMQLLGSNSLLKQVPVLYSCCPDAPELPPGNTNPNNRICKLGGRTPLPIPYPPSSTSLLGVGGGQEEILGPAVGPMKPFKDLYGNIITHVGKHGSDPRQIYYVYKPANATVNSKIVVLIHGGGWFTGPNPKTVYGYPSPFGLDDGNSLVKDLLKEGHVVVSVLYRLPRIADEGYFATNGDPDAFEKIMDDVDGSVRSIRENFSACVGVNPDNIHIWGESAGGHIALMYSYTRGLHPDLENSIKSVITFYAPSNIQQFATFLKNPVNSWTCNRIFRPLTYTGIINDGIEPHIFRIPHHTPHYWGATDINPDEINNFQPNNCFAWLDRNRDGIPDIPIITHHIYRANNMVNALVGQSISTPEAPSSILETINPVKCTNAGDIPTFILHGTEDVIAPYDFSTGNSTTGFMSEVLEANGEVLIQESVRDNTEMPDLGLMTETHLIRKYYRGDHIFGVFDGESLNRERTTILYNRVRSDVIKWLIAH